MPAKFNSRGKQVNIAGVDLLIKPLSLGQGESLRNDPNLQKDKRGLYYVLECSFLLDGSKAFDSLADVEQLEGPTFSDIYDVVADVNCWTEKAAEEVKKN